MACQSGWKFHDPLKQVPDERTETNLINSERIFYVEETMAI